MAKYVGPPKTGYELTKPHLIVHKKCNYIIYYYTRAVSHISQIKPEYAMELNGCEVDQYAPLWCEACKSIINNPDDVLFVPNSETHNELLENYYKSIKAFVIIDRRIIS